MMMTRSRLDVLGSLSPYLFVLGFAGGPSAHVVR